MLAGCIGAGEAGDGLKRQLAVMELPLVVLFQEVGQRRIQLTLAPPSTCAWRVPCRDPGETAVGARVDAVAADARERVCVSVPSTFGAVARLEVYPVDLDVPQHELPSAEQAPSHLRRQIGKTSINASINSQIWLEDKPDGRGQLDT